MKRLSRILCCAALAGVLSVSARELTSVLVKEPATGHVLVSNEPDARRYPASLTKLMTLYLLFDAIDTGTVKLDQKFTVSAHAAEQPQTKVGLRVGSRLTAEECIEAIIVKSANDAAVVVAEALAGSEEAFAARMTAKAHLLGMNSTVFRNASGLPDDAQFTTASDMATLGDSLMTRFPDDYHYFGLRTARVAGRTLTTHNFFLGIYKGADGLKTGYTRDAGYNLVASAERGGHRLLGVVLGAPNRPNRDEKMVAEMNRAFTELGVAEPKPAARAGRRSRRAANLRPLSAAVRTLHGTHPSDKVPTRPAAGHRSRRAAPRSSARPHAKAGAKPVHPSRTHRHPSR